MARWPLERRRRAPLQAQENDFEKHFKVHEFLKNIRPPEKIVPGGSVANSVYAMAQFNDKVCFSGKVSDDTTGDSFINSLIDSGVDSYVNKINKEQSGECLVLITPDNERTMNTYLGSSALLDKKDINIIYIISKVNPALSTSLVISFSPIAGAGV